MISPFTVDFETTGKDATTAYAIEAALASPDDGAYGYETFVALPEGVTIPPETSAVHHIIEEDLEGAPAWADVLDDMWARVSLGGELEPHQVVMIAHNAEYERAILDGTAFYDCQWVCTFKCSLIAWPNAPSHSNEALRYWLGVGRRGRKGPRDSHSALHDCKVTAAIFNALYGWFYTELCNSGKLAPTVEVLSEKARQAIIDEMVRVSQGIAQLPVCPIGKERGKPWTEIDGGFLSWCLRQPDMREDVKHAARKELERRRG